MGETSVGASCTRRIFGDFSEKIFKKCYRMKSFLVKLYSAVIFVSVEIEAFKKQVRSDIGTCHFDNTTCPLKLNEYSENALKKDESCQKKKKANVINKLLLKNNTSLIQNYKDIMMISASVKNKATVKTILQKTLLNMARLILNQILR